jgi:hypothetical protein
LVRIATQEKPVPGTKDPNPPARDQAPPELDRSGPDAAREDARDEATPCLGENQAGFVKDPDLAPGSRRQS